MAKILIIDDDTIVCQLLCDIISRFEHETFTANTLSEGFNELKHNTFDIVFLDVGMPDGNGLEVMDRIRTGETPPEVIIITGAADADSAELAIKNGAWDYLQKPFSMNDIVLPLKRVLQYRENLVKSITSSAVVLKNEGIIGNSAIMHQCLSSLAQASSSDANVLITGETGTGKELFARALHLNSSRADKPFVVVDCAALPETLKESALFGHEKGAFTGADKAAEGLVKQADGGTLFLDEVGELDKSLQKVFLRVLQEKRFRPVGSKTEIVSNFRLVAATNRDLEKRTKENKFRSDLLYRLRAIAIQLPPLRQHAADIKEIVLYHTTRICERTNAEPKGFSPDFFSSLMLFHWPGNVRELVNTLESAIAKAGNEPILFPTHLPAHIRVHVARSNVDRRQNNSKVAFQVERREAQDRRSGEPVKTNQEFSEAVNGLFSFSEKICSRERALENMDKIYLKKLMEITRGNIKESCDLSGLGRTRLYTLLKKYNISRMGWEPVHDNEQL